MAVALLLRDRLTGESEPMIGGLSAMHSPRVTRVRAILSLLALLSFVELPTAAALTIYRLGGASLPTPDADSLGIPKSELRFVQLAFEELDGGVGSSEHLVVHPDSILPHYLPAGVNVTPLVEGRGGFIRSRCRCYGGFSQESELRALSDGDPETEYLGQGSQNGFGKSMAIAGASYCIGIENLCRYVWISLDGTFPLQLIRISTIETRLAIPTYTIGTNDGDVLKFGTRDRTVGSDPSPFQTTVNTDFDVVAEVTENDEPVLEFEFSDEPVREIVFIAPTGTWAISEFELFFEGFAVDAHFTTDVIDLGGPATIGPLSWSGALHPGSDVELSMRNGATADPNIYYRNTFRGSERSRFDAEGEPLDRRAYLRLESGEQAGIAVDLDNWNEWPPPPDFASSTADLRVQRPRRYAQVRSDFHSGGRVDYVQFAITQPPVATRAVAEIEPGRARAREMTRFTYLIVPQIDVGDRGFDSIAIDTPTPVDRVESVTVNGVLLGESEWSAAIDSTGFVVRFPALDARDTGELIEIVFHTRVFDFGASFQGRVFSSDSPWEVPQYLEPGDADFLADSNSLTVELSDVGADVLSDIELSTGVLTPNGDGVNDMVEVGFQLVNLSAAVPLTLQVFDLSGATVAEVVDRSGSGPDKVSWNGTADGRDLLAPGIYLLRLEVETDKETFSATRAISLAY